MTCSVDEEDPVRMTDIVTRAPTHQKHVFITDPYLIDTAAQRGQTCVSNLIFFELNCCLQKAFRNACDSRTWLIEHRFHAGSDLKF